MQHGDRIVVTSEDSLMTGFVGVVDLPSDDYPDVWWVYLDETGGLPLMFRENELAPEA